MSIPEPSEGDAATVSPAATEAQAQIAKANERTAASCQKLMFEEFIFVGNELPGSTELARAWRG